MTTLTEIEKKAIMKERADRQRELLEKKAKLKKRLKIAGGVFVAFVILVIIGLQPIKGPLQFGICKTFLELQLKFPQTLQVTYVEEFDKSLRMYYTFIDSFGSVKSEMLECDYRPFSQYNIESVKRNRKPIETEKVEKFNKLVPIVINAQPDLTIPFPPDDDLNTLKRDY